MEEIEDIISGQEIRSEPDFNTIFKKKYFNINDLKNYSNKLIKLPVLVSLTSVFFLPVN